MTTVDERLQSVAGYTELPVVATRPEVAHLLESARRARHREDVRGLVQVMATAPTTIARIAPMDDLGDVAAALNRVDSSTSDVVYTDRWSASVHRAH